jgi:SpoVK/Ycf46/Vps4 family AAA+-type ATPase
MNNSNHDIALKELDWHLRSKRPIIYLISHEEMRVIESIKNLFKNATMEFNIGFWDIISGLSSTSDELLPEKTKRKMDQTEILQWFDDLEVPRDKFFILILKDFNKFFGLKSIQGQIEISIARHLRNLSINCVTKNKALIILSPELELPQELEKNVAIIDWPLPEKEHLHEKIIQMLDTLKARKSSKLKLEYSKEELEYIVDSFQGLTLTECEQVCAFNFIKNNELNPEEIIKQKKDIIRKSGLLDWIDVNADLDSVGGLNELKNWLNTRKRAFTQEAVEFGLPENPKGILLVGVQGAGKSLCAKAVANYWNFPLLRLDMGKIFSGLVGSSESNMRQVFKVAESVAPAILWCDEIDKGMSGSSSSSMTDGGTTSRVMGSWLTWMQEKTSPVFVVATANDVSQLPPELLRKGRFDEIFFVDLPDAYERQIIFEIHLKKRKRDPRNFDIVKLVEYADGFTGAEIEASIVSAMYEAFYYTREINNQDLEKAIKETVPLSKTMAESINALRKWANNRARNASQKF